MDGVEGSLAAQFQIPLAHLHLPVLNDGYCDQGAGDRIMFGYNRTMPGGVLVMTTVVVYWRDRKSVV